MVDGYVALQSRVAQMALTVLNPASEEPDVTHSMGPTGPCCKEMNLTSLLPGPALPEKGRAPNICCELCLQLYGLVMRRMPP